MVRDARAAGTDVTLVIETKHPNPRGGDVEHRVATVLSSYGWDRAGSPVRVISFSAEAMERLRVRLPAVERSFLVEGDLGPWRDGDLPDGVQIVGVDIRLLEQDPGFVARAQARGHQVDAWTVHEPAEITLAQSLGVATFTTDWPDRVAQALALSPG